MFCVKIYPIEVTSEIVVIYWLLAPEWLSPTDGFGLGGVLFIKT